MNTVTDANMFVGGGPCSAEKKVASWVEGLTQNVCRTLKGIEDAVDTAVDCSAAVGEEGGNPGEDLACVCDAVSDVEFAGHIAKSAGGKLGEAVNTLCSAQSQVGNIVACTKDVADGDVTGCAEAIATYAINSVFDCSD